MSDTTVMNCKCCETEDDCIDGLCQSCSDYNYKLQKQSDLLTLGLLQEKGKVTELEKKLKKKIAYFNKQVEEQYNIAFRARKEGVKEGLCKYAWWKDGTQYVGTCGTTLKQALNNE